MGVVDDHMANVRHDHQAGRVSTWKDIDILRARAAHVRLHRHWQSDTTT